MSVETKPILPVRILDCADELRSIFEDVNKLAEDHFNCDVVQQKAVDAIYDRVEKWQRDFLARHANGDLQYYADAASGLNIALQEIDRERHDRTSQQVWDEYQALKKANAA